MKNAKTIVTLQTIFLVTMFIFSANIAYNNTPALVGAEPGAVTMLAPLVKGGEIDTDPASYAFSEEQETYFLDAVAKLRAGEMPDGFESLGTVEGQEAFGVSVFDRSFAVLPNGAIQELAAAEVKLAGQVGVIKTSSSGQMTFSDAVTYLDRSFGEEAVQILTNEEGVKMAVLPEYGRIMALAPNENAPNLLWINKPSIDEFAATGEIDPQFHNIGGIRIWLTSEGANWSIFFEKGVEQVKVNWHTPDLINIIQHKVIERSENTITTQAIGPVTNYLGTEFLVGITSEIEALGPEGLIEALAGLTAIADPLEASGVIAEYTLENLGENMTKETGAVAPWALTQIPNHPTGVTVTRVTEEAIAEHLVNAGVMTNYFEQVGRDRLAVNAEKSFVAFRTDGTLETKLAFVPEILQSVNGKYVIGNYHYDDGRIYFVAYQFDIPEGATSEDFANNHWDIEQSPTGGEAAAAYSSPNKSFTELEILASLKLLATGEINNLKTTQIQLTAPNTAEGRYAMSQAINELMELSVDDIENALPKTSSSGVQTSLDEAVVAVEQIFRAIDLINTKTDLTSADLSAAVAALNEAQAKVDAITQDRSTLAQMSPEQQKSVQQLADGFTSASSALQWNDALGNRMANVANAPVVVDAIKKQAFTLYVEATPESVNQYTIANGVSIEKDGLILNEIEAIQRLYGCEVKTISKDNIHTIKGELNAVVVALTEDGVQAAQDVSKVMNLKGFDQGKYLDFTSLAVIAKGWTILDSQTIDARAKGHIKNIISLAYKRLTGVPAPQEFLNNPAKFILEVALVFAPGVVYEEGELENLHMQALQALIAA